MFSTKNFLLVWSGTHNKEIGFFVAKRILFRGWEEAGIPADWKCRCFNYIFDVLIVTEKDQSNKNVLCLLHVVNVLSFEFVFRAFKVTDFELKSVLFVFGVCTSSFWSFRTKLCKFVFTNIWPKYLSFCTCKQSHLDSQVQIRICYRDL